jgi:hypothetical protein
LDSLLDSVHPADRSNVQLAVSCFGLPAITQVYSKNWEERRKGYLQIRQTLVTGIQSRAKAKDSVRAAVPLIVRGLADKLYNVYSAVLDLLKQLLGVYIIQNGLVESEGPHIVNSTYQLLINRTGDTVNVSVEFKKSTNWLLRKEDLLPGRLVQSLPCFVEIQG